MIELKQCCKVPFPDKLYEQYEVADRLICANVNASKVMDMMKSFIEIHDEPLFFILEIPSKITDEEGAGSGVVSDLHKDVYYMDGLTQERALQMLRAVGEFLIKDGLNTFGFGGHLSHEEILLGRYNILTVYTAEPSKYETFFGDWGIEKVEKLVTAWDTFDREHPGECSRYEADGKTIFDIPEAFKDFGLYFAERRGENQ